MEEKLMDKVISDALKEDIVLPDIINLKVDEALDNIINGKKDEKKKRRVNNRFLKVAIITLAIVGGVTVATNSESIASYAKSVIDSVFKTMKDDRNINENFDKYSTKVISEATDKDITIKVTDVFSDGKTLKIGYLINDKKFKERHKYYNGSIWDNTIYIDDKEASIQGWWETESKINDNTLMVVKSYKFTERIQSKFNMKWKITNICKIPGEWELNFEVNSEALAKESKIIEVNKEYKIGECKYYLKDITYTPTGNYINIKAIAPKEFKHSDDKKDEEKVVVVTDENGVIIQTNSGYELMDRGENLQLFYEISGVIDHMPREYNIIPVTKKGVDNIYEEGKKLDISNMEKITVKVE